MQTTSNSLDASPADPTSSFPKSVFFGMPRKTTLSGVTAYSPKAALYTWIAPRKSSEWAFCPARRTNSLVTVRQFSVTGHATKVTENRAIHFTGNACPFYGVCHRLDARELLVSNAQEISAVFEDVEFY